MTQNTTVMVFTNQLEAIRKQPRKVQKDLMAAMLCFLAFGEQPDFNGMTLRNKQLAESVWMLMQPVLERSRRLRCTDCPRANELEHATSKNRACPVRTDSPRANAHARAEEEKEIEIEEEREVEKESEERNLSFADADASVSSAPADDAPADIQPGKKTIAAITKSPSFRARNSTRRCATISTCMCKAAAYPKSNRSAANGGACLMPGFASTGPTPWPR